MGINEFTGCSGGKPVKYQGKGNLVQRSDFTQLHHEFFVMFRQLCFFHLWKKKNLFILPVFVSEVIAARIPE